MYYRPKFVTNSSSTHSMVIVKNNRYVSGDQWKPGEFGWQQFILSTPEDKEVYMAVMLFGNMLFSQHYEDRDEDAIVIQVNRAMGKKVLQREKEAKDRHMPSYYIDHQSKVVLPQTPYAPPGINIKFFRDFKDYVVNNDKLIIVGGNDNGDGQPRLSEKTGTDTIWKQMYEEGYDNVYAYHLDRPRWWKVIARDWHDKKHSRIIKFPKVNNQ